MFPGICAASTHLKAILSDPSQCRGLPGSTCVDSNVHTSRVSEPQRHAPVSSESCCLVIYPESAVRHALNVRDSQYLLPRYSACFDAIRWIDECIQQLESLSESSGTSLVVGRQIPGLFLMREGGLGARAGFAQCCFGQVPDGPVLCPRLRLRVSDSARSDSAPGQPEPEVPSIRASPDGLLPGLLIGRVRATRARPQDSGS
jgi:hypothetical protein